MKSKKITFYPSHDEVFDVVLPPVLSKKAGPKWYKAYPKHLEDHSFPLARNGNKNLSVKACFPVMDKINFGYTILLSSDVQVNDQTHRYRMSWSTDLEIVLSDHPLNQIPLEMIPSNYEEHIYKWRNFWTMRTPPGYSVLITHPSYRNDLPFMTLDAVVDSDKMETAVQFPFLLKKDFVGVIKRGTPIAQIFPFKRESWTHEINDTPYSKSSLRKLLLVAEGWYRDNVWERKYFK